MIQNRREWLLGMGSIAAPLRAAPYAPVLGAQIYVWTQQFAREKKSLADGVGEALPAIKRAGYRRVALTSNFFEPPAREKTLAALRETGLELCDAYNGGVLHEPSAAEKTIAKTLEYAEIAKSVGCRSFTFNCNPKRDRKTDEELATQAKYLNILGGNLRARGMKLQLHQHAPEMQEESREWRHDLRHTDPKLVNFCLDIDWVKRGGQDVMTLLRECGKRAGAYHLRSMKNGVWMEELGDGDVDYRPVAAYLKQNGFRGILLVELAYEKATNPTRPLEEDLRRSREYAERIFGVRA